MSYDLQRMERSYVDLNKREYELTKHVSLAVTDPSALIACARPASVSSSCPRPSSISTTRASTCAGSRP